MTQIELTDLLRQKQEECTSIVEKENEELQFLETFFERNDFRNIESVANTELTAFMMAYLLECLGNKENREEAYAYLKKDVVSIKGIIEDTPPEGLENLLIICERLKKFDALRIARDLFAVPKRKLGRPSIEKLLIETIIEKENLDKLYFTHDEQKRNIGSFIDLYLQMEDGFISSINIIRDIKRVKEDYQKFQISLSQHDLNSKERKYFISKYKNGFDFSLFNAEIKKLRTYYENLTITERSKKRTAQKDATAYETLEQKITEALQKNEITDAAKLLAKVSDQEVRLEVLKLIYKHNEQYYEQLLNEYESLSKNSIISYQRVLNTYGIVNVDIKTITHNPVEVVETVLSKLKQINITSESTLVTILQLTDIETFEIIYGFITQGILTPEFVTENILIFSKESKEYKNFTINIAMFKELGFNPNNLSNSQTIFIGNPNTISCNIEILKVYDFEKSFKKELDYSFLSNPNLMIILDTMLELGLEQFLEEDLSILNYYENIDRLRVIKELNIPVETKEELIEILTTPNFLIPDDMISSYITIQNPQEINIEGLKDDIDILKDYQKTSRVYDINGVLLSKNRIKRNYHQSEGMENRAFYSIFEGYTISKKDYETIRKTFSQSLTQK